MEFQTKQQIAINLIDRSLANGIRVAAWTFDEFYTRDSKFLDALQQRDQAYVAEIPKSIHLWTAKPKVIRKEKKQSGDKGKRVCHVVVVS